MLESNETLREMGFDMAFGLLLAALGVSSITRRPRQRRWRRRGALPGIGKAQRTQS